MKVIKNRYGLQSAELFPCVNGWGVKVYRIADLRIGEVANYDRYIFADVKDAIEFIGNLEDWITWEEEKT